MTIFALPNVSPLAHRAALALWRLTGTVVVAVPDTLYTWQRRYRMRREMLLLDDRLLRDMGINRYDAQREARRPFWKP